MVAAGRAIEPGVPKAKTRHRTRQPVALAVGSGRHGHDGLGQMVAAGRAIEPGVTEGEDPAIGRDQPVALAVPGRHRSNIGLTRATPPVEPWNPALRRRRPAVGRDQPVATRIRAGRHAHDRFVQGDATSGSAEADVAEVEHAAIGRDQPVAGWRGRGAAVRWRGGAGVPASPVSCGS